LRHCAALAHLDLGDNQVGHAGAESLAGVLAQCTALTHLNLEDNHIGPVGAETLAGVLAQCPSLVLDLSGWNGIDAPTKRKLAASWCGQASALVLYEPHEDIADDDDDEDEDFGRKEEDEEEEEEEDTSDVEDEEEEEPLSKKPRD
jgi:hypothetical protein